MILNYKYGTIFRQIIDTKQVEWCGIMDGSESNPILKFMIDQLRPTAARLFHKCPYEGDLEVKNITMDSSIYDKNTQVFPQGNYRADAFIFKDGSEIMKVSVEFELKSPLKESYG